MKLILIASTALLLACNTNSQQAQKPDCETRNYGTIKVTNNSKHGAKIVIDDNVKGKPIWPGETGTYGSYPAGTHHVKMIQSEGYLLSPTEWKGSAEVLACSTSTLEFGKQQ